MSTLKYWVTRQWLIFPRLWAFLNICFSQAHFKGKNLRDRKNIQNPQDRKIFLLISSINQHQIPNWNHWSREDIFSRVALHQSFVKHIQGWRWVWFGEHPAPKRVSRTEQREAKGIRQINSPPSLRSQADPVSCLRCIHWVLSLLLCKVIKELETEKSADTTLTFSRVGDMTPRLPFHGWTDKCTSYLTLKSRDLPLSTDNATLGSNGYIVHFMSWVMRWKPIQWFPQTWLNHTALLHCLSYHWKYCPLDLNSLSQLFWKTCHVLYVSERLHWVETYWVAIGAATNTKSEYHSTTGLLYGQFLLLYFSC